MFIIMFSESPAGLDKKNISIKYCMHIPNVQSLCRLCPEGGTGGGGLHI
jgi:hypothetical protein